MEENQIIDFSEVKRKYPALSDIKDIYLSDVVSRIQGNENARTILVESRRISTPINFTSINQALLDHFQLPEGWGDLLVDLTKPLVEGISSEMTSAMLHNIIYTDPMLILLVKLILLHALFAQGKHEIRTRSEALREAKDDAFCDSLASSAQELLDVLTIIPKLRGGGTRLLERMLHCINALLNTPN